MRVLCKCCGVRYSNRPRGLCWACYYRPGSMESYPSTSIYARRGIGHSGVRPAEHTLECPGSEAKIQVMIDRVARGEDANHDGDVRLCDQPHLMHHAWPFTRSRHFPLSEPDDVCG